MKHTLWLLQYNQADRRTLQMSVINAATVMYPGLRAAMSLIPHNWATLAVCAKESDALLLRRHFDHQFTKHPGKPLELPKRSPQPVNPFLLQYNTADPTPRISIIPAEKACASARTRAGALLPYPWATLAHFTNETDAEIARKIIHDAIDIHRRTINGDGSAIN